MTRPAGSAEALVPYVAWVIEAYLRLPHTPRRARQQDRHLAGQLHERGVPIHIVETALLLATARRTQRPVDAAPLPPIRSLHYFLPVIEELIQHPPSACYLRYLQRQAATIPSEPVTGGCPKKDVFT